MVNESNKGFLSQTAKKIVQNEINNFHNVIAVFPNRRAIRFFNRYMYENINSYMSNDNGLNAVFTCKTSSIKELVTDNMKDIKEGDNLQLIYLLYNVYCQIMYPDCSNDNDKETIEDNRTAEDFNDFYSLGELLLNDFDQIDKELVNAQILFRNLEDYKNLEADPTGYLTKEQIDLINRLFNTSLGSENSSMRKNFISVWNNLYAIYEAYNTLLDSKRLAYPGKMYREFARRLENGDIVLPAEHIKIIGFSVLNNAEKKIFRLLKERYVTDFYWDYDEYYVNDEKNEAGIFIRENLALFPQSKDLKDYNVNNIAISKQVINIISSPYETTSLAYITRWLDEVCNQTDRLERCAIVLNDESLIPLVIKSLPKKYADKINITMGYPLNQTWLYGEVLQCLNDLIDNNSFSMENVFNALKEIAEITVQNNKEEKTWQISALKKICTSVSAFVESLEDNNMTDIEPEILKKVLRQSLCSLNLDIVSDGVSGVQVMGMLETRALDFDYVLMLSANDDNLPNLSKEISFIPYSFRKAYDMMNADRKAGVFAYYFYRLLHQAKRVDYIYTTVGGENKLKEKSRFIRQIEIEFPLIEEADKEIRHKSLTSVKALRPSQREYYFCKRDIENLLSHKQKLSPSALNNLIHCQQKFYLNNLRNLREAMDDEEYLAIAFGNIFHNSADIFYKKLHETHHQSGEIDKLIEDSVNEYLSSDKSAKEKRVCGDLIHLNMIKKYIKDVYIQDCNEKNEYLCGEKVYSYVLDLGNCSVLLEGRLDRMDYIISENGNKVLRILDYKTGTDKDKRISSLDDIFANPEDSKPRKYGLNNIFEILFYCYLVYNNENVSLIKPELMYLSQIDKRDLYFITPKNQDDEIIYYNEELNRLFEQKLKQLVLSLIEKEENEKYKAVISKDMCEYCEYKLLCILGKRENI